MILLAFLIRLEVRALSARALTAMSILFFSWLLLFMLSNHVDKTILVPYREQVYGRSK
jgi:hypothetical protein